MFSVIGSICIVITCANAITYCFLYARLRPDPEACPRSPLQAVAGTFLFVGAPVLWSFIRYENLAAAIDSQWWVLMGFCLGSFGFPIRAIQWRRDNAGTASPRSANR